MEWERRRSDCWSLDRSAMASKFWKNRRISVRSYIAVFLLKVSISSSPAHPIHRQSHHAQYEPAALSSTWRTQGLYARGGLYSTMKVDHYQAALHASQAAAAERCSDDLAELRTFPLLLSVNGEHEGHRESLPLRLRGAGVDGAVGKENDENSDLGGDTNMATLNPTNEQHGDEWQGMDTRNDETEPNQDDEQEQKACADGDGDDNREDHSELSEITGDVAEDSERKSVFVFGIPSDCRPRDFFNLFRHIPGFEYTTVSSCMAPRHNIIQHNSIHRLSTALKRNALCDVLKSVCTFDFSSDFGLTLAIILCLVHFGNSLVCS